MSTNKLLWDDPRTHTAMLDRSPCGTGTSAILAFLSKNNIMDENDILESQSIMGSTFQGSFKVVENGIVPLIEGIGFITQYVDIVLENDDIFKNG